MRIRALPRRPGRRTFRAYLLALTSWALLLGDPGTARAVSKNVDLGGDGTAESVVSLTVVSSSPVKIQNKIKNSQVGEAFTFRWPSAGPGGFNSSLASGTSSGVGAIWTWQTTQQVYSFTGSTCTNDLCATRTSDSRVASGLRVPGRSLSASNVTVTNESLTSSLITFFSPPTEVFRFTSSVELLAGGLFRYRTVVVNPTPSPLQVNLSPGPIGCESICGNDVREGGEVCDGTDLSEATCGTFDQQGTLGCSPDCQSYNTDGCVPFECGNESREGTEACDGSDLGNSTCENMGGSGGELGCTGSCTFDLSGCTGLCGNGVVEGDEQCDGTSLDGETCSTQGGGGGGAFSFSGFPSDLVCIGSPSCLITPNSNAGSVGSVLRLTGAGQSLRGSAWHRIQQPVKDGFTTTFQFRISEPSGLPADGLAFVIQNNGLDSLGAGGGGMAYDGIPQSLAVEFDTYHNSGNDYDDPNANHVAVQSCGLAPNSGNHLTPCALGINYAISVNLSDEQTHTATITYTPPSLLLGGTGSLEVFLDGGAIPVLTVPYDLFSLGLGGPAADSAWVGFSAATGYFYENHDILSWEFTPVASGGDGLACSGDCTFDISQCTDICGNGVQEAGEECDGQDLGDSSCDDVEAGGGFVTCDSSCQANYSNCTNEYCGNGQIDAYEACDGENLGEHSCDEFGGSGTPGCTESCSLDLSSCTDVCGNGVREGEGEGAEDCDGSDLNGFTCEDFVDENGTRGSGSSLGCSPECGFDTTACFPESPATCDTEPQSEMIPENEPAPTEIHCEVSAHPAKEVSSSVVVCGDLIPDGEGMCPDSQFATEGPANIFVPDLDVEIGDAYFTVMGTEMLDPNGDGLIQTGETVGLKFALLNVGSSPVSQVSAVLSSPDRDLDLDGVLDRVTIDQDTAQYPDGPCFAGFPTGSGDCDTVGSTPEGCKNSTPFIVTFPQGHPGDVGRKFILTVSYVLGSQEGRLELGVPLVLGVGGKCGDGTVDPGEQCDDGNLEDFDCCSVECLLDVQGAECTGDGSLCTDDVCDADGTCTHPANTAPCDDGNACTRTDTCQQGSCVGANPVICAPLDQCHVAGECNRVTGDCSNPNAPDGPPCDDDNPCTTADQCVAGSCVGGAPPSCDDGNVCTNDTCAPAVGCISSCNNTCNAKGDGYWKKLCKSRQDHHADDHADGEFFTSHDVDCVNESCTFSDVQTIDQMCDVFDDHGGDRCVKAEKKFLSLLLNLCRCRLQPTQTIDTRCEPRHRTVAEVVAYADATLCNPNRTDDACRRPECSTDDITSGTALWQNTLRLERRGSAVRLSWAAVYGAPVTEASRKYRIWRRAASANTVYTMIGEVNSRTFSFLDSTAGAGSYEYEVTATY